MIPARFIPISLLCWLFLIHTPAYACDPGFKAEFWQPPGYTAEYDGSDLILTYQLFITAPWNMRTYCGYSFVISLDDPTSLLKSTNGNTSLAYRFQDGYSWNHHHRVDYVSITPGLQVAHILRIVIPGGQTTEGSRYQAYPRLYLMDSTSGGIYGETYLPMDIIVPGRCTLEPPDVAMMDFSDAVQGTGIPMAVSREALFRGAGCNVPAVATISAEPMRGPRQQPIHFTAALHLPGQSLAIDTRTSQAATVNPINIPDGSNLSLTATILPSTHLAAGNYQGSIRLTINPLQ